MKNRIYFSNQQKDIKITPALRGLVTRAINLTLKTEEFERGAEVSVTMVTKDEIHALNLEQRGVDRPTDVLSFPMFDEDFDDDELAVLGDIVLCPEKAKEQSEEFGHSFERELAFLCVHSTLHLLGYDHELSEEDDRIMRQKQTNIVNNLGLSV
ncbi:MAG: rRNA maturation RNase YbeY [Clostridia bacterium]|jgi:probable rRNA maturation factor|nr:rRNA maturation RNase YbeY [Clostridia bacterium]